LNVYEISWWGAGVLTHAGAIVHCRAADVQDAVL